MPSNITRRIMSGRIVGIRDPRQGTGDVREAVRRPAEEPRFFRQDSKGQVWVWVEVVAIWEPAEGGRWESEGRMFSEVLMALRQGYTLPGKPFLGFTLGGRAVGDEGGAK